MQTIDYDTYLKLVSEDTKNYVDAVIKGIIYVEKIPKDLGMKTSVKYLYPFVNAYAYLFPENKEALSKTIKDKQFVFCRPDNFGYSYEWHKEEHNAAFLKESAFVGKNVEEIPLLTPEDILLKAFNNAIVKFSYESRARAFDEDKTDDLEMITSHKHLAKQDEFDKRSFSGLKADEIEYLKTTGKIFGFLRDSINYIKDIDPTESNIALLATLGGLLKSPYRDIQEIVSYMNNKGLTFDSYTKLFGIFFKDELLDRYDPTAIINHYFTKDDLNKIICGKDCYGDEAQNLQAMLTVILGKFSIDYDSIAIRYKEKNKRDREDDLVNDYMENGEAFYNVIFTIYENLCHTYVDVKDKERTAILLAMLSDNTNVYTKFLDHNGVRLDDVLKDLRLDEKVLQSNGKFSRDTAKHFLEFIPEFSKVDIPKFLSNNTFLDNFCTNHNIRYDFLGYELLNRTYRDLTNEEKLAKFESLAVPELVGNSVSSLTTYGDQILAYNNVITDEMRKLPQSFSFEELTEVLKQLKPIQRPSLIAKLFNKKEELTVDNINKVRSLIDSYIKTLREEIEAYDYFKEYITIYLSKIFEVYKNYHEYGNRIEAEAQLLNPNDIMNYAKVLDYNTKLDVARSREKSLEVSIQVNNQELAKICNIIKSHNNTINALTMAKNDILPLIASEATINRGIHSERESMMLSQNLVGLFQSLVDNNIEDTKKNLDLLQTSPLPQDTLYKVNMDVCTYIEQVENKDKGNSRRLEQND